MSATRSCLAPSTRFRGFRRRGFLSSLSPTRRAAHADALLGISPGWDFERRWTISTGLQLSLGTFSTGAEEAVVIGDAGEFFTYDLLNRAYRKITQPGCTTLLLSTAD